MAAVSDDNKTPVERALDLFFYAPLGLLLGADEVIPQLVERGRQQAEVARMFGEFAVRKGSAEAEKAITKLQQHATEVVEQLAARSGQTTSGSDSASADRPASAGAPAPTVPGPIAARPAANGDSAHLAIPDYDSLSASQVVPRLAGLAGDELEAVRTYEAAHRGRKTILNKVAQLQAG
jgi:hypothetical protein